MIVSLTSARSSPGVTSLAVGMAYVWQELGYQPLLVEADPAGGVLGLRFDLPSEPSFTTLSADLRRGSDPQRIVDNTAEIRGVRTLLSSVDPAQASRVLARSAGIMAAELPSLRRPVVIDAGRLGADSPSLPLLQASHQVLVLCRPRVEEAQSMLFGLRVLRGLDCRCGLVVVGERPHDPHEIAALAGVPLVAVLPDDAVLATALTGGVYNEKRLKRSLLWRSITALSRSVLHSSGPTQPHQIDPVVAAQAPAAAARSLPAGATAPAPVGNIAPPLPVPAAPIPVGLAVAAAQAAAVRVPTPAPTPARFDPAVTGELPRLDRAGTPAPPPPPVVRPPVPPAAVGARPDPAATQPAAVPTARPLAPGVMAHWPPPTPRAAQEVAR